jgi:diketogulonate reductase-like aldo/keto reductase
MKTLEFGSREKVRMPDMGLGTWKMGGGTAPDTSNDERELDAIRTAIDIGYSFIDTAEMYGGGHTEELVGRAAEGKDVFIATKVWQTNLHYDDVLRAAEASLKRLRRKQIDLYQVHWPNDAIPLRETMKAMEKLVDDGRIRYIGVSNFGPELIDDARSHLSRCDIISDQVSYSLADRTPENGLTDYCRREGIGIIAYEPLSRGRVFRGRTGKILAEASDMVSRTRAQVALNWLISKGALPIPKSSRHDHLLENFGAAGWRLPEKVLKFIDSGVG